MGRTTKINESSNQNKFEKKESKKTLIKITF